MYLQAAGVVKGSAILVAFLALVSVCAAEDDGDKIAELMGAAFQGNVKKVTMLLDKGVDVNSRYIDNETALIFASLKGHVQIVKVLLAKGANVRAMDNKGKTALAYATQNNHVEVVKILKSHMTR